MSLLETKNITKSFGKKKVLKGVNLTINQGDIVGLIGKSGCGKSTLIKILVGFLKANKGTIIFKDEDVTRKSWNLRKIVGYTTQENSFYERLTVEENMRYYAGLYSVKKPDIKKILESVQLWTARKTLAVSISGGMKRRLDFAISLVHDPEFIILDEPTTGLDPLLVKQFWKIVQDVVKHGNKTVLVSSHILPELQENCNKVFVVDKGVIAKEIDVKKKNLEKVFGDMLG